MDKNARICIIGAGPAGTSAAMYLEKAGYDNYVIYEKSGRVGGKCLSPRMAVKNKDGKWEDRTIEMGAVMGCETYFLLRSARNLAAPLTSVDLPWAVGSWRPTVHLRNPPSWPC